MKQLILNKVMTKLLNLNQFRYHKLLRATNFKIINFKITNLTNFKIIISHHFN